MQRREEADVCEVKSKESRDSAWWNGIERLGEQGISIERREKILDLPDEIFARLK